MSRILITGSSDGLGSLTAQLLASKGHTLILHARNPTRAADAKRACPGAHATITGDLSTISGIRSVAEQANALGPFDTVMHNAGLYLGPFRRTEDDLPSLFAVNTLAAYMLACLMQKPKRLVFVSSGLHHGGDASLDDVSWRRRGERGWSGSQAYADTKLHNIVLAFAFARRWGLQTAAVDPGWVATKMGGKSASDDLGEAVQCFADAAVGDVGETGYWYQSRRKSCREEVKDVEVQEKLLGLLEDISGVKVPE